MNVVGIIAEYNPFHNGHLFHLEHAKKICNAEYVVCVMSGHFLQRGEPALFDKWSRAKMAVSAGADLVCELPFAFACRSAGMFAEGGVKLLAATNLVTHLCFGSEADSLNELKEISALLCQETALFRELLLNNMQMGLSYPTARSKAIQAYYRISYPQLAADVERIIASPNNILGIEYLNALSRSQSAIQPMTVKRHQANYHDQTLSGSIASATAVRAEFIKKGLSVELQKTVPNTTIQVMCQCMKEQLGPVLPDSFSLMILSALRRMHPDQLSCLAEVTEGLEYKLKNTANLATNQEELLTSLKSKRYTRTRLQRILSYLLLNFTKELATEFDAAGPCYIRILATSKKGQDLLRIMKESSTLPIIHRAAEFTSSNHFHPATTLEKMLQLDIRATDLYVLGGSVPRRGGLDYLTNIVRLPV